MKKLLSEVRSIFLNLQGKKIFFIQLIFIIGVIWATNEIISKQEFGWDYQVTCGCLKALESGFDPYYVKNSRAFTGKDWSCTYQSATFYAVKPWCLLGRDNLILIVSSFIFFGIVSLWSELKDKFYFFSVLFTYLCALPWFFLTSNIIAGFEFVFMALVFRFLIKEKYLRSSFVMGVFCFFKLAPLIFLPGYFISLLKKNDLKTSFKYSSLSIAVVVVLNFISYIIAPEIYKSFFLGTFSLIPNQHSSLSEQVSGATNPTFTLLIKQLLRVNGLSSNYSIIILFIIAIVGLYFIYKIFRFKDISPAELFSLLILFTSLFSPRTKPYFFILLVAPYYLLTHNLPPLKRTVLLFVFGFFPIMRLFKENLRDSFVDSYDLILNANQSFLLFLSIISLFAYFCATNRKTSPL